MASWIHEIIAKRLGYDSVLDALQKNFEIFSEEDQQRLKKLLK